MGDLVCYSDKITYTNYPNTGTNYPDTTACEGQSFANELPVGVCTEFPGPVATWKLIEAATYTQCSSASGSNSPPTSPPTSSSSTSPPPSPPPPASTTSDSPCFGRDTSACLLLPGHSISPAKALETCFNPLTATGAVRALMTSLKAGDHVLTLDPNGNPSFTRVLFVQHALSPAVSSNMLRIRYEGGELSLTADHLLFVDGNITAARAASAGSHLEKSTVLGTSYTVGGVINPMTVAGTILAISDNAADSSVSFSAPVPVPVLASVYGEWTSHFLSLERGRMAFPLPIVTLLSRMLPSTTQRFYSCIMEGIFPASSASWRPLLSKLVEAAPAMLHPLLVATFDLSVAAAFFAHAFAGWAPLALLLAAARVARRGFAQK